MLTRRFLALATLPALFVIGCGEKDNGDDSGGGVDADGDGYTTVDDCDDSDAAVNPGAAEVCDDSIDNNCDGTADEDCGGATEWVDASPSNTNDDAPQYSAILRTDTVLSGGFFVDEGEGYFFYNTEVTDLFSGDSSVVCANEYTLTADGDNLAGDCDGCDFGFEVTATLDNEDGTADCSPSVIRTFGENTIIRNPRLAYFSEYVFSGTYGNYYYEDVVANGISADYTSYGYGYYAGPYWQFLAFTYDGNSYDDYVYYADGSLYWDSYWSDTSADGDNLYYNACDYTYFSYAYGAYDGPSGNTSEIACNDYYVDAWEVDLSDAYAFRVTVDTIAADSAADLAFWVNDPDGCSVAYADDSFDCTYEPTDWQCPAVEYDVETPGTYTVYVKTWGYCTGDVGAYDIAVSKEVDAG